MAVEKVYNLDSDAWACQMYIKEIKGAAKYHVVNLSPVVVFWWARARGCLDEHPIS